MQIPLSEHLHRHTSLYSSRWDPAYAVSTPADSQQGLGRLSLHSVKPRPYLHVNTCRSWCVNMTVSSCCAEVMHVEVEG